MSVSEIHETLNNRAISKWYEENLEEVLGKEWGETAWKVYLGNLIMNLILAWTGATLIIMTMLIMLVGMDTSQVLIILLGLLILNIVGLVVAIINIGDKEQAIINIGDKEQLLRIRSRQKRKAEKEWIQSELDKINAAK